MNLKISIMISRIKPLGSIVIIKWDPVSQVKKFCFQWLI